MLVLCDGHNFAGLWLHFGFIDLALFLLIVRQRRGRRGLVENIILCANDTALLGLEVLLNGNSVVGPFASWSVEVIRMNGTTNAACQATRGLSPLFETKESKIAGMTKLR